MTNLNWDPQQEPSADQAHQPNDQGATRRPFQRVLLLAMILLLLLLLLVLEKGAPKRRPPTAHGFEPEWYYDQQTGDFHASRARAKGAQHTRSQKGHQAADQTDLDGVRAMVFRRGFGADATEPFVGYLIKPAPGLTDARYEAAKKNYGEQWGKGLLVRRPNDKEWVSADTPQGRAIIAEAYGTEEKCQQGRVLYSR